MLFTHPVASRVGVGPEGPCRPREKEAIEAFYVRFMFFRKAGRNGKEGITQISESKHRRCAAGPRLAVCVSPASHPQIYYLVYIYSRKRLEPYRYLGRAPKHATTIERREGAARSAGSPPRPVPVRPEGGGPRPGAWHGPRPVGRTVLGCLKAPQMRARIEPHPARGDTRTPARGGSWGAAGNSGGGRLVPAP